MRCAFLVNDLLGSDGGEVLLGQFLAKTGRGCCSSA